MTKQLSGTYEWADKTFNVCHGCKNDCAYCFAKAMAIRFGRAKPETWSNQVLIPEKLAAAGRGKQTSIMFPSTHDITPENLDICMDAIGRMLARGHRVLIVSKPHLDCVRAICERFNANTGLLMFRFTIGSTDNRTLLAWEPNAPVYEERLFCLQYAYGHGFATSVSCEPMLDANVEQVVNAVYGFVTETIWIGTMNGTKQRLTLNGAVDNIHVMARDLTRIWNRQNARALYSRLKDDPKIRWKDGFRRLIGGNDPLELSQ